MIEVVIADDNELVRLGLQQCVEHERDLHVAGLAENGLAAVAMVLGRPAHVVLMDVSMPVMDGLAAAREIALRCPATKVVMLTMFAQVSVVHEAFAAGAAGYLLKTESPDRIVAAIRAAHAGARPFTAGINHGALRPG